VFTGIVKELGLVKNISRKSFSCEIEIQAEIAKQLKIGDSIAVNGVCLTATKVSAGTFVADAVQETLNRTTLGSMKIGDKVNLEFALSMGEPMGGHIVNGHIDGVGAIKSKVTKGNAVIFEVLFPSEPKGLSKYAVEKGSIAVDGISLTIVEAKQASFTVSVIPFTVKNTTLGFKSVGEKVNIEVDIMAKYVEKNIKNTLTG